MTERGREMTGRGENVKNRARMAVNVFEVVGMWLERGVEEQTMTQ